jgi:hypothetical protein
MTEVKFWRRFFWLMIELKEVFMIKIVLMSVVLVASTLAHHYAVAEVLITETEAALPTLAGSPSTRGISRGPSVKLESPGADSPTAAPFKLKVKFEPRGDVKIDPASVKVLYLKSPIVDLTPRLKHMISSDGIDLSNAVTPPGIHPIRVVVKDSEGRETNLIFNMVVRQ